MDYWRDWFKKKQKMWTIKPDMCFCWRDQTFDLQMWTGSSYSGYVINIGSLGLEFAVQLYGILSCGFLKSDPLVTLIASWRSRGIPVLLMLFENRWSLENRCPQMCGSPLDGSSQIPFSTDFYLGFISHPDWRKASTLPIIQPVPWIFPN